MAERNDRGREGEIFARKYLERKGYKVLQTNWHWHHYELDIITVYDNMLVVVEVKTRSSDYLLSPEEAVDNKKIKRTVAAADAYVRYFNIDLPVRFDIIAIVQHENGYEVDHIEDAFFAPGY